MFHNSTCFIFHQMTLSQLPDRISSFIKISVISATGGGPRRAGQTEGGYVQWRDYLLFISD
ncbi:hypothetical protein A4U42_03640 [Dickeya solani IPO 2222]|nr:hypothetical protein A4U42_03640 [Dickeya solani IPO 2222]